MKDIPGGFLQSLAEGAVAVGIGLTLAALMPAGDPFRATLLILPWVVAALRALERHSAARRTPPVEGWISALVLGGLVATTLARARFGLAATDWFLAAGFLLLLGQRAVRLVLALRPSLGNRLPDRPSLAFFWLPLIVYLAIQPWSSLHRQPDGDEPFYLLVAHSLAYDLDLDLANNYATDWQRFMERAIEPQLGDPVGDDGEKYSRHSFLLPLILAPAYRLAGRAGAMAVMAIMTAALAWMFLRLARHYTPRRPGATLLAYGLFALSPPLLLYSYQIWVEVPAALLLTLALDGLLTLRGRERWDGLGVASVVVPIALLPVLKIRFALLAGPLFVLALWRARPPKRALQGLAAGFGATGVGLLIYNIVRFDNPLRLYSWHELDIFRYSLWEFYRGSVGMFYDAAFGLFPCAPIWCLILPALVLQMRRPSSLLIDSAMVSLPYLIFVTPRIEWYGGWSPPFRYALVFLPLLALGLIPLLARRKRPILRTLIVALGAATLVLTLVWVVIPGWTYNFADGRTHLLDEAGVRLDADIARLFPSTVRHRSATWVWLAASLLLIPVGLLGSSKARWPFRSALSWGVGLLLLVLAGLPVAGRLLPTRVVHLEDAYVGKYLGSVYPPPWTLQRPRYVGSWVVPAGGGLVAPVTPGGQQVTIRVISRLDAKRGLSDLSLWAGDSHLGSWTVNPNWTTEVFGPLDWPAGERLSIRGDEGMRWSAQIDRVELVWR